jgi:extracellular factor (EF) 3-hydroxypalmitic acid methyl ester biosynthesis protein
MFNMACGPAIEVQSFLRDWDICDHTELSLLDFNQETLEHVSSVLEGIKRQHARKLPMHFIKKSVYQVFSEANKTVGRSRDKQYDVVYCAGLLDYLPDPGCRRLVNIMFQWLAPGGLLVATNVDASNPLKYGMDFLLDWHLQHRTAQQVLALRPADAPAEQVSVTSDLTGVNLFLEARRPEHA